MIDKVIQEYGTQVQVSAEMIRSMDKDILEDFIKQNLSRDAEHKGWISVSEPEMFWGKQAYRIDDSLNYVRCEATDEGAFFYAGAKMKVVQQ